MEFNSNFYESTAIGHHYRSKRSLALAYLVTIGSKAIVLMEANDGEHSNPHNSVQKSFDDEAAIKRKMVHHEQVRQFQRAVTEKPGVLALKRGRNGEIRQIYLRLKEDKHGTSVVWKSWLGGKKSFLLDDALMVEFVNRSEEDSRREEFQESVQILRLKNKSRIMDIQFLTTAEAETCVFLLQSYQAGAHRSTTD